MLRVSDNPPCRFPADRALAADRGAWWVARVKSRHEKALAWELTRLGIGYYLPLVTRRTVRRDTGKARKSIVCLFPGYLALVGYQERKRDLFRTGRLLGVLEVVDQDRFVAELDRVRRALESDRPLSLHPGLARGRRVLIASGPLAGISGRVVSLESPRLIYLNVEMFNQAVKVAVTPEEVEVVEEEE